MRGRRYRVLRDVLSALAWVAVIVSVLALAS